MEAKHTAGPWQAIPRTNAHIDIQAPQQPGYAAKQIASVSLTNHEANARLIAAAPELLAACEMAVQTFIVSCRPVGNPDVDDAAEIRGMVATLRAAIAKATQ